LLPDQASGKVGPMRTDPPETGPELAQLTAFLDLQRATMLVKCEGLTREQLSRPHPPSTLTLAGLLNHLALVEDSWFTVRFAGQPEDERWAGIDWEADPDYEFRTAADLEPDELRRRYEDACTRSRDVVAAATSLDQLSVQPRGNGEHFDLRWTMLHLIEETARHAGHADLIREAIDGVTGE
jgi:uncharacterized damage-inducible protein DinB